MSLICPKCNTTNVNEAKFCKNCGVLLEKVGHNSEPTNEETNFGGIITVIVILALVGFLIINAPKQEVEALVEAPVTVEIGNETSAEGKQEAPVATPVEVVQPVVTSENILIPQVNNMVNNQTLLGKHNLTLQWISWEKPGYVVVNEDKLTKRLYMKGKQVGGEESDTDYITIDGEIINITSNLFTFQGIIATKVYHIFDSKECVRNGTFTFKITQNRKYWRLQEMDNPCDQVTDYVDIYF
jgi:hypothetical protein